MSDLSIRSSLLAAALLIGGILSASNAAAVEGGSSLYLLGKRGPLAAFVPKPGMYLTDDVYLYDAGRSGLSPFGNRLVGEIEVDALVNVTQLTWVTEATVLGGRFAVSAVVPIGNLAVDAGVGVGLPIGPDGFAKSDRVTGFGDPALGSSIGWKKRSGDRFRAWSVYSSVVFPIGDYEKGRIANLGHNRWGFDLGGAYTMANFKGGRELSGVLGFTINGDNLTTDYSSGHEMHLEIAAKQHLPHQLSVGLVGYWNEQLSADKNNGALLGDFEGRVFGAGPEISYQFTMSKRHPLTVDLRWHHEFEARKRIEGDAVFLTFSLPLSVTPPKAQDWSKDMGEGGAAQ